MADLELRTTPTNGKISDNTAILNNFRSIRCTPILEKALKLKKEERKTEQFEDINFISQTNLGNVDENFNEYSNSKKQLNINKKAVIARFRETVKKIIIDYKKNRNEKVPINIKIYFVKFFID